MTADLFRRERPALGRLVAALVRLPPLQRQEIARKGWRAKAVRRRAILRRLGREANAEARRLMVEA